MTVFVGYMAGSHHKNIGGTSDFLCLPEEPQWGYTGPHVPHFSTVYGTEYQVPESGNPFNTQNLYDREIPCVLCQAERRFSHAVLPATVTCPAGWTKEYGGYMMAMYYNHQGPRSAVCMDNDPEKLPGGIGNSDQSMVYLIQTKCGSLPCSTYRDKELTCTVCTQ